MSLEMLRFGWQKLLVNQVPQKGGRGGPPPPDYQGLWNQAQATFGKASEIGPWAATQIASIGANRTGQTTVFNNINNRVNAELANIDGVINQTSGIPDYIFSGSEIDKGEALTLLRQARNGVAQCLVVVPPEPPPPPPPVPPPPTSPKLDITPSIPLSPISSLMPIGVFEPIGCIPSPVIRFPINEYVIGGPGIGLPPPLSTEDGEWEPTGNIEGVGTWTEEKGLAGYPPGTTFAVTVFGDNGKSYRSIRDVDLGVRWSYKPWRWRPRRLRTDPPAPPPPIPLPPTEFQIVSAEIAKQTKQLQAINRIMLKPIDPAPPENIYPTTSWQYELWNKGYTLKEIHYAEDAAAQQNLLTTTNGDFALFKVKVEDLLQDAILAAKIPFGTPDPLKSTVVPPPPEEIVPVNRCGTGSNGLPILVLEPTIDVMPYQPSQPKVGDVFRCVLPVPSVDLPTPYFDEFDRPINPKKIPGYLRRLRTFQSRGVRNRPIDINDLPSVPAVAPNTVPTPGNWEDCLIGSGATVAQLDTIRRTMGQVRLAPNADRCDVTKQMLSILNSNNTRTDPQNLQKLQTNLQNIQGVTSVSVTPATIVKSSAIAQRKTQQARRGALNNRK